MTARRLAPESIALPRFPLGETSADDVELFDLSSHARARAALARGLAIDDPGFNIFVLGEDRSGRMTATLAYLEDHVRTKPTPSDWVYLNNFKHPHKPNPYRLPPGQGRKLRIRMAALLPAMRQALKNAFESPDFANDMQRLSAAVQGRLQKLFDALNAQAHALNLHLERTPQGLSIAALDADGNAKPPDALGEDERRAVNEALDQLREPIRGFNVETAREAAAMTEQVLELRRQTADLAVAPLIDELEGEFDALVGLKRWLVELREDVLDHLDLFLPKDGQEPPPGRRAEDRYAVNLMVDNGDTPHQSVVLEPNPTFENLFGCIEYQSVNGVLETNFSMIRAGSVHRANGGILVLRAEAIAREPDAWEALKGALRDRLLRIVERPRRGALPLIGAPSPKPIPLDIKVALVGAPNWFYAFFSLDPSFQSHFRIKADIDPDIPAEVSDLATYRALIGKSAQRLANRSCAAGAIEALLGQSARWAGMRDRLTSRFELVEDVLSEAAVIADGENSDCLDADHIDAALEQRRQRNSRLEDRAQEQIALGTMMIDTEGAVVGQVNGLTVRSTGDHSFGSPTRVTARTYAGARGVLNIERDIALGGPIQQKGVLVLEGFLKGRFAQRFPISFSASITFEQSYGGVEGDSASLAELIAILSSLADVPVRQDIAITGSVNQRGRSQAIGGANEKIEGFFRSCEEAGLTGSQGVIVPAANEIHLALRPPVATAVADERFHIWSVATVEEALELLTEMTAGEGDGDGHYPADTVYGRVMAKLTSYDRALSERAGREFGT
ncbi:MAG: AAA family ATPase [Alphaproteobacteria bacterium]|nr:AAA family ATPase [Alphaproteobacteria bacterium]